LSDESPGPCKLTELLDAGLFLPRACGFSLGAASLFFCVACGGAELEFADWTLPIEEGVPVFEYSGMSIEERRGSEIGAVEELILGADPTDPRDAFYQVLGVEPDPAGNIYVLDRGNNRVQVFDPEGTYLRTMGRQGEGPGEFDRPLSLAIAGDQLVVRAATRRLSIWSLDGEHVRDIQVTASLSQFVGIEGGFVARYSTRLGDPVPPAQFPASRLTFAALGTDGEEMQAYAELEEPPPAMIELGGGAIIGFSSSGFIPTWAPRFAALRDGSFFLTTSEEYQVHAYGPRRWSMRVAWARDELADEHIDNVMAGFTDGPFTELRESDLEWPERFQAIVNLEVDGHGHIYVFPFYGPLHAPIPPDTERPEIDRPVDVFSADGEHLFSGMISIPSWNGSLGDFVYRSRLNPDTDETEVVRHRLVEPFR
jgi:hypothetical protein